MDNLLPRGDPRVENWPLMNSPMPVLLILSLYWAFVFWLGPKIMKNQSSGFHLRPLMVIYNVVMVAFSFWLVYEFAVSGWLSGYTFGCQLVDRSTRPKAMRMANVCWLYFITKLIELFDTVLFILRKKFELVSFLHVFHHSMMPISWWFGVKYVPGGIGTFHAFLNSIIHFFMYTYYGLAAAGPRFQRYLWWKKYMTTAQIVQFIIVIFHSVYTLSLRDCDYPKLFNYWILSSALIFLFLFAKFYSKTYKKPIHSTSQDTLESKYNHKIHSLKSD
uniref:Elongation of very long chain fatty acids protein n=1 Tax=Trichobilharzia regenti TaxID=157069 RepID=A0AA85J9H3_TRIRE|nr:unnamed protein product [Trichobilharzia regenti]